MEKNKRRNDSEDKPTKKIKRIHSYDLFTTQINSLGLSRDVKNSQIDTDNKLKYMYQNYILSIEIDKVKKMIKDIDNGVDKGIENILNNDQLKKLVERLFLLEYEKSTNMEEYHKDIRIPTYIS